MQKEQRPATVLDVLIFHPAYGGNGGIASEVPEIREWEVETVQKMKEDPRVGEVYQRTISDTPITMVRNQAVKIARHLGCHLLLMVDSDINPNLYRNEPWFVPFWDAAFDAIYDHYGKGPLVVGAPYCGPPPHENIYVFQFENLHEAGEETPLSLEQYTRAEASKMRGLQECAALPTGMILYDMRAFELIEPDSRSIQRILELVHRQEIPPEQAYRLISRGWFHYEWTDSTASQKASTEDVVNTREIALAGCVKLGYNPLRCAWSSWVGHWKPWCVGKPRIYSIEEIASTFHRAVVENRRADEVQIDFDRRKELGITEEMVQKVAPSDGNGKPEPEKAPLEPSTTKDDPEVAQWPDLPSEAQEFVSERVIFGRKVRLYGHMTPMSHLKSLRDLAREVESRWKAFRSPEDSDPMIVFEIGAWVGESAIALADGAREAEIYTVDNFRGNSDDWTGRLVEIAGGAKKVAKMCLANLGELAGTRVHVWANKSLLAARYWGLDNKVECSEIPKNPWADYEVTTVEEEGGEDEDGKYREVILRSRPIELCFIDARHDYDSVVADITAWLPHMSDTGVMVGHDYKTAQFPGVEAAVKDVFGYRVRTYGYTQEHGGFWMVRMEDFHGKKRPATPARASEAPES